MCGVITIWQSMPVRVAFTSTLEMEASGAGAFAWLHKLSVCTEHPKLSYDKASAQWTQWTQHQFNLFFSPFTMIMAGYWWSLHVHLCADGGVTLLYVEIEAQTAVLPGIKPYPAFTPDTRIMAETNLCARTQQRPPQ